jgi:hypothetical protein
MTQPVAGSIADSLKTSVQAVYNWNYAPEIDQLRSLYANALERQWIATRDLDWDAEIDANVFSRSFSLAGIPIDRTDFWKELPGDTRWEIARRSAAFMLSNFLHGEQGALMAAAQLVEAVPHLDGKFYAATQTLDEARHVEVFASYIRKLDTVYPIAPALRMLLDSVLSAEHWTMKAVGMQIVIEGIALYSFRDMRNATEEPLLKKLLTLVSRDEARHTAYGIQYLSQVVPTLPASEIAQLEDFAFECSRRLIDSRTGASMRQALLQLWQEAGLDLSSALERLAAEREKLADSSVSGGSRVGGPLHGFVLPTLGSIGLLSERIRAHFEDMFRNNGVRTERPLEERMAKLPTDLDAWIETR